MNNSEVGLTYENSQRHSELGPVSESPGGAVNDNDAWRLEEWLFCTCHRPLMLPTLGSTPYPNWKWGLEPRPDVILCAHHLITWLGMCWCNKLIIIINICWNTVPVKRLRMAPDPSPLASHITSLEQHNFYMANLPIWSYRGMFTVYLYAANLCVLQQLYWYFMGTY